MSILRIVIAAFALVLCPVPGLALEGERLKLNDGRTLEGVVHATENPKYLRVEFYFKGKALGSQKVHVDDIRSREKVQLPDADVVVPAKVTGKKNAGGGVDEREQAREELIAKLVQIEKERMAIVIRNEDLRAQFNDAIAANAETVATSLLQLPAADLADVGNGEIKKHAKDDVGEIVRLAGEVKRLNHLLSSIRDIKKEWSESKETKKAKEASRKKCMSRLKSMVRMHSAEIALLEKMRGVRLPMLVTPKDFERLGELTEVEWRAMRIGRKKSLLTMRSWRTQRLR